LATSTKAGTIINVNYFHPLIFAGRQVALVA
jgi:hypothetical protein